MSLLFLFANETLVLNVQRLHSIFTYRCALGLCLDEKLTWKPHIKAKRRQLDLKIKKYVLATKPQVQTIPGKQTNHLQTHTQTNLDIWYRIMGL
jgi:hypothetical protein